MFALLHDGILRRQRAFSDREIVNKTAYAYTHALLNQFLAPLSSQNDRQEGGWATISVDPAIAIVTKYTGYDGAALTGTTSTSLQSQSEYGGRALDSQFVSKRVQSQIVAKLCYMPEI